MFLLVFASMFFEFAEQVFQLLLVSVLLVSKFLSYPLENAAIPLYPEGKPHSFYSSLGRQQDFSQLLVLLELGNVCFVHHVNLYLLPIRHDLVFPTLAQFPAFHTGFLIRIRLIVGVGGGVLLLY